MKITKEILATALAESEYSVNIGRQTSRYWFNQYMKFKKADLVAKIIHKAENYTGAPHWVPPAHRADRVIEIALEVME